MTSRISRAGRGDASTLRVAGHRSGTHIDPAGWRPAAEPVPRPAAGSARSASNTDLNSSTDLTVEQARSNVRDVKVHMAGDQITAYVLFDLHGKDLSLTLEGRLSVQDGYLRLSPTRLMLGSLPIPQATVERAVSSLFDSPGNRERFRLPPDIRGLSVENGELVVTWR